MWGIDPRKDPFFRHYQTISYMSFAKIGTARSRFVWDKHVRDFARKRPEELKNEHIFDGVSVGRTGNIFMFCDITDPMIRKILDTKDIRSTCAPTFQGWYHIGTWAKATVLMKDKM
jgi:general transcription factor 3C polypeptide 5 (transcription factor C subunit 1)